MVNQYLVSLPVKTWEEARDLGSETNWIIMNTLRKAGLEGLTIEEISHKTRIPKSTVYSVMRSLSRARLVASRRAREKKWGAPTREDMRYLKKVKQSRGKRARIYFENMPWGNIKFDKEFYEKVQPLIREYSGKLWEQWFGVLKEMVERFRTDENLKKFFPTEKRVCEYCGWNHEAADFVRALNLGLMLNMQDTTLVCEFANKLPNTLV